LTSDHHHRVILATASPLAPRSSQPCQTMIFNTWERAPLASKSQAPFRCTVRPASLSPTMQVADWRSSVITLQVEKCAEQPAHSLAFHSFQTSTVHIGRRPGYDERGYGAGTDNPSHAMFRCPVMSRKHAKIAFADTGHVREVCCLPATAHTIA
jgi:hypothetical protein